MTPYLDENVFDFLSTLPGEMLVDDRFHTDTIGFAFPKFAQIPQEDEALARVRREEIQPRRRGIRRTGNSSDAARKAEREERLGECFSGGSRVIVE